MLKKILSISGKPGLYKLVSQGKNMLILESLIDGRRLPSYQNDKVVSLGEIAMYTDEDEKPLREVFEAIKTKENGGLVAIDPKKADEQSLRTFMKEVLPNYDKERVRVSDIKKLIAWYNLLVSTGNDDFSDASATDTAE